jgi:hypothetical protein
MGNHVAMCFRRTLSTVVGISLLSVTGLAFMVPFDVRAQEEKSQPKTDKSAAWMTLELLTPANGVDLNK